MSSFWEKIYHVLFKKRKNWTAADSEWRAADPGLKPPPLLAARLKSSKCVATRAPLLEWQLKYIGLATNLQVTSRTKSRPRQSLSPLWRAGEALSVCEVEM